MKLDSVTGLPTFNTNECLEPILDEITETYSCQCNNPYLKFLNETLVNSHASTLAALTAITIFAIIY
jgi:hypothetical protein